MARIRINTRTHTKEKPYLINSYFLKIGKAKTVNRVSKIRVCMWMRYVLKEFLWLKNVKSRSKIALFLNERHFEIWFPKKKTIKFFWSKLSKLHKKDPILHVATTFSLKQGETRTSHGPIPHPVSLYICISGKQKLTLACKKRLYIGNSGKGKSTLSLQETSLYRHSCKRKVNLQFAKTH